MISVAKDHDLPGILDGRIPAPCQLLVEQPTTNHSLHIAHFAAHDTTIKGRF